MSNQRTACLPERENLPVGERACRPVPKVVGRHHRGNLPAHRFRTWRHREPLVQRAALVGFEVRESHVAQSLDRHDTPHRLPHQRKQPPRAGMEQQRRVVNDQILVEIELIGAARNGDRRVDAVDAIGDLMNVGAGLRVGNHWSLHML